MKLQLMYTQSIVDEVSDDIDLLLNEKVKTAFTLANTPLIIKSLETSNSSYADLSDKKREGSIKGQNKKWKSIENHTDNFILKFTNNDVSRSKTKNGQRMKMSILKLFTETVKSFLRWLTISLTCQK